MPQAKFFYIRLILLILFSINAVAQTNEFTKKQIKVLVTAAKRQMDSCDYEKSMMISRVSLSRAFVIKDDYLIAVSYNIIAENYRKLFQADNALEFYNKSLTFAKKSDNDTLISWIYNNYGRRTFFDNKEYKKGLNFFKKSLEYAEKCADTNQIIYSKISLVTAYFKMRDYKNGYFHLKYINNYHKKFDSDASSVTRNVLNGDFFDYLKDYQKAEKYYLEAIFLGKKAKSRTHLAGAYLEYSNFLQRNGKYKEAYKILLLNNIELVKIQKNDNSLRANVQASKFKVDEYKREINKIENERDLQSQSLKKTRIIILLFVLVSLVLLFLIFTLYKNNKFKKRANYKLIRSNKKLKIATQKANEATKIKSEFVSTITHELRTPLYGVVGITDILVEEHKEFADSKHLKALQFSAKYLLSLVNDILQVNKIEASKATLVNIDFSIDDVLKMIKNSLSYLPQNNNIFSVIVDSKIPKYLKGDKIRLVQILMNLVNNALKFTNNGEVQLSATLINRVKEVYYIEFKVSDNGIGIELEDQNKIFENFVQLGRNEGDYRGTGLGLSIVKQLLKLFNSDISVVSEKGIGTTFTFIIGFEYSSKKDETLLIEKVSELSSTKFLKFLVVEDNHINQLVTKKIIERNHHFCTLAIDGMEALEILKTQSFDVILMDINMPIMDGFETTKKIRENKIYTPVIALTAYDETEIEVKTKQAGINLIIVKPFDPEKLFSIVYSLILNK